MELKDIIPKSCPQLSTSHYPNGTIREYTCGLTCEDCKGHECVIKNVVGKLLNIVKLDAYENSDSKAKEALDLLGTDIPEE